MLTDSVQPYNKSIIDLACSVRPLFFALNLRPHARSISRYYSAHQMILKLSDNFTTNKELSRLYNGPKFYILFTSMLPFKNPLLNANVYI
jgi:hypothetical protein